MNKENGLDSHKEKLLTFVNEHLCKRPGMFVGRTDFEKLGHFYTGYTVALETHLGVDLYRGWDFWIAGELKPKFKNHV